MLRRGLRYLDELDAVEEKERKEAEERERATAATPSTVGFREVDLSALDDAFVPDFGETWPASSSTLVSILLVPMYRLLLSVPSTVPCTAADRLLL